MLQKITLIGNLGGDPELRYTTSGQSVCNFSVATSRKWTGGDGQAHEETVWWRANVWGKMGEACNTYLAKGRQVYIEGRVVVDAATGGPRIWFTQDGQARASFEITAFEVKFLGSRGDSAPREAGPPPMTEDEIPF